MISGYNSGVSDITVDFSLFWGVKGIDQSGVDQWDAQDIGEIEWDYDFDITVPENQAALADLCTELRTTPQPETIIKN